MDLNARSATQIYPLEFQGSGAEYFRIWIVNLLLTVVTVGIYSPWAKVRRLRYFYGSTTLAGSSFEYHGRPVKILKGRLMATALIAPYYLLQRTHPLVSLACIAVFVAALPFIIVQSRRFQMRMSSWRNIRFGFDGGFGRAAQIYLGLTMLIPFTLGLLFPYVQYAKQRFVFGESRLGTTRFEFGARPGRYYAAYLAAAGWWFASLILGTLVIAAIVAVVAALAGISITANPANMRTLLASPLLQGVMIGVVYLGLIAIALIPVAVAHARITNEAVGNLIIGSNRVQSTLAAGKLARLYLGNLALTVLTLGLYSPWAKVRLLRYQLGNTSVVAARNLEEFAAADGQVPGAVGEELGDLLDVDFGF